MVFSVFFLSLLRSAHHQRQSRRWLIGLCVIAFSAAYTVAAQLPVSQLVTLSSPSLELLAAMPREVTGIAGADDASAIITAARAMPLLGIARRFGYLTATENAWSKLEDKLALHGTGHRVLLNGPLVIGMAKDGDDGFVIITGLSAGAASLLRSKLEAVPTELVEGRSILSIERDGLRMAVLDTPAWLQRPKNIATVLPFIAVLAPPTHRGPELLRSAVKLLSTPQQREQRSGAVIASKLCAASLPDFTEVTRLGPGKQAWAAHRAQGGAGANGGGGAGGAGAGGGWAAALGVDGRTLRVTALLQEPPVLPAKPLPANPSAFNELTRPLWLAKRPPLQEPLSADVGLLIEQIDRTAMEALPAPLNWLTVSLPMADQASVLAAIEQLPGPGGRPIFGATAAWVLRPRDTLSDVGAQARGESVAIQTPQEPAEMPAIPPIVTPSALVTTLATSLAATATQADVLLTEAATRLERYGRSEAATPPPAFGQMGLRPEAVRQLRLSMDPATLTGRIAGSRTVMSWRAVELAGATSPEASDTLTGVVARLWPQGSGGSAAADIISSVSVKGQTPIAMLRWTLTPFPQLPLLMVASPPPNGAKDPPLPAAEPLPLGEDVISQGLVRPGVLSPMIEAPGQTGFADILRTIELFRWRITAVPTTGQAINAGPRRRIEIEMRQIGGNDADAK